MNTCESNGHFNNLARSTGFGLSLANSPVAPLTDNNKNLYNGGSEWQNDYGNLPDLQQTFYRNYDAALGRWIAVDPVAESAESMTVYQYAGNNPIMLNDPLGDLTQAQFDFVLDQLKNGIDGNYFLKDGQDGGGGSGGSLCPTSRRLRRCPTVLIMVQFEEDGVRQPQEVFKLRLTTLQMEFQRQTDRMLTIKFRYQKLQWLKRTPTRTG